MPNVETARRLAASMSGCSCVEEAYYDLLPDVDPAEYAVVGISGAGILIVDMVGDDFQLASDHVGALLHAYGQLLMFAAAVLDVDETTMTAGQVAEAAARIALDGRM